MTTIRKDYGGLNFRDHEGFNLVMVDKQGWKLLTIKTLPIFLIEISKQNIFK
jgi:hypothetical protein